MNVTLDAKVPDGPMADKWQTYKEDAKLVNPANKRKYKILMVGSGLAGAVSRGT
jgi:succinate dehydrogenase / fumarate reductase flavoprotein subunit